MRNSILLLAIMMGPLIGNSQIDPVSFNLNFYNLTNTNPAYAGSEGRQKFVWFGKRQDFYKYDFLGCFFSKRM